MSDVLRVNMLGEFSIAYGDKAVNDQINRSKKLWTLLEYLITFRDREISQNELIELLWPDDDIDNPANTLKTLLHRVRSLIEGLGIQNTKKMIVYRGGTYAWDPFIPYTVDTEVFEKYSKQAYSAEDTGEKITHLLSAIDVYKGDFLPKSAFDPWVVPINAYYHSQYIKIVLDAVDLLKETGRDEEIVRICQKAVMVDPYEELLHYHLIKAMVSLGKQQQALKHYDYVKDLFFTKFGINPSQELTSLYKEIVDVSKSTELDLGVIKEGLKEHLRSSGCFYCEYEIFKNVYQIEARSAARTGQVVYVCLLSISTSYGTRLEQKVLNKAMEKLKDTIVGTLRRGDVFARYSVSQYLIMLPTTNYENGDMVMRRICKTFRKENPKMPVIVQYSLQPLSPIEMQ